MNNAIGREGVSFVLWARRWISSIRTRRLMKPAYTDAIDLGGAARIMSAVPTNVGVFFGQVDKRARGWYWAGAQSEKLKGAVRGPFETKELAVEDALQSVREAPSDEPQKKGRSVINLDEDAEDGRVVALQSLSNTQLIEILQHHDGDDDLTQMVEEELTRRKTDGAPPQ
jgi:hypothetical protein